MTDNTHNDDLLFDRLVDGELSTLQRQQLIASLDDREDGWRKCALAFLESQTWGQAFQQIVADPTIEKTPTVALPQPPSTGISAGRWLAIAAGLLIAFGIGWLSNSRDANDREQLMLADGQRQEMPLRDDLPAPILDQLDPKDAVTLLVRDTSGNNQRLQVPLMEVSEMDENLAGVLPAELRNRFRDQGFDVQRRRRFAPMFFEQDEKLVPMVVPVDDTYIVPVNRPIY